MFYHNFLFQHIKRLCAVLTSLSTGLGNAVCLSEYFDDIFVLLVSSDRGKITVNLKVGNQLGTLGQIRVHCPFCCHLLLYIHSWSMLHLLFTILLHSSFYVSESLSFSAFLCSSSSWLVEKRMMMTSPISSVAPPLSAVALPLGNQQHLGLQFVLSPSTSSRKQRIKAHQQDVGSQTQCSAG